ncbi:MAG: DUF86 domain-containing protein [Deltaproteobacteria bacterium]|nr:DUF86 domain-containing protein [Deltaproteobacteria bacterium]MBI3391147.1 DUF86 domain-containing protein [Deltaproteobacteria bacterium]
MLKSDRVRLLHMLDAAREAVGFAQARSRSDLDSDRMLNLSLVRLIEIIGEAAARVSPETRSKHPAIRWPGIIGMRHRIAHGYDQINFDIVWEVATVDLPPLIAQLEHILSIEKP